jgi:F-type H+-transporting ATPase subunit b
MGFQEVDMNPTVLVTVASGTNHPLIDIDWTIALQFLIFAVMFFVARAWLFKPYLALREARRAGIEGARTEAERMVAEADGKLADYQKQLASARSRAADEQRAIRAQAIAHEREVTDKARAEVGAAMETSKAKVATEVAAARAELMPRAEGIAKDMVRRLLGREVA